jgi:hypothetical protein
MLSKYRFIRDRDFESQPPFGARFGWLIQKSEIVEKKGRKQKNGIPEGMPFFDEKSCFRSIIFKFTKKRSYRIPGS